MSQLDREDCAQIFYEALDGRHEATASAFLDDVSLLHVSGGSGLAGDYQGEEAILGLLGRMAGLTDGTLRCGASRRETRADGTIVVRGSLVAVRHGRKLDTAVEVKVNINEGTVREVRVTDLHEPAFDDFWS
jgi:hypothetical protein